MKISFHGAARTVTGSKHLLHLRSGMRILLDCGMFQGMGKDTDPMNRQFGFDPAAVDVLLLSHAHIDHCGLIPRLVAEGFGGKIYCTPATKDLASILLEDSAAIQEGDIKYSNKERKQAGKPLLEPLYSKEDALAALDRFEVREYGTPFKISDEVEVLFTDAGHIIGSACVHLKVREGGAEYRLTFSGDLGRYRDVILRSPAAFPEADYILMESTYGNSLHEEVQTSIDQLRREIEHTCLKKGGKLILPAFSVGRTQELLYALNTLEEEGRLPATEYFLDSPLSVKATEVVKRFPHYFNRQLQAVLQKDNDPFQFKGLRSIKSVEDSKALNYRNEPCVIISASGMAEAGRVKHHISNNVESARNTILMTGYCEPRSLGGRLMSGAREVGIFGVRHEVHAEVRSIRSMSAHGDYEDMCQWLGGQDPGSVRQLFLVHGEAEVQEAFAARLRRKGFRDVLVPEQHSEIHLEG